MASTLGIILIASLVLVAFVGLALSLRQRAEAPGTRGATDHLTPPNRTAVQFERAAPAPPTIYVSSLVTAPTSTSASTDHQDWRTAPLWLRAGIGLLLAATVAVELFGLGISTFAPADVGPVAWQQAVIAGVVLLCGLLSLGLYRVAVRRVYGR